MIRSIEKPATVNVWDVISVPVCLAIAAVFLMTVSYPPIRYGAALFALAEALYFVYRIVATDPGGEAGR